MVIAPQRVARDARQIRVVERLFTGRLWPVGQAHRDDGQRAGLQRLRVGAQAGVFGHIIHFAVAAEFEPVLEVFAGRRRNLCAGDSNTGETECQCPAFNACGQHGEVEVASQPSIGVLFLHSPHHSPDAFPDHGKTIFTVALPDEAATIALGREMAPLLAPGMVVWLDGDLGAGKTTLVRALLRGLGHTGPVKSPTYTLVEVYVVSSLYWYHFDFYRFNEPEEFDDAGLAEYFRDDAVCLVEWPAKAEGYVPAPDLVLAFRFADGAGTGRLLEIHACSEVGRQCLSALQSRWLNAAS